MDGVLNVHKPAGITSHDVVLRVRRLLKERRVGHTGTLDPLATGVLVVCIGQATRIARYLEADEKEYSATMRLGIRTDTLDSDGTIVSEVSYTPPSRETVLKAVKSFTGAITQTPPAFSALKIGGVPSYRFARAGEAVAHKSRAVSIHSLRLDSYENPTIALSLTCSKGVYVRSLCADIGDRLGMGGHLTSLIRTRSGRFRIGQAVSLDALARMMEAGRAHEAIVSIGDALGCLPSVAIDAGDARRVFHGNEIAAPPGFGETDNVRLFEPSGALLALASIADGRIRPHTVFTASYTTGGA